MARQGGSGGLTLGAPGTRQNHTQHPASAGASRTAGRQGSSRAARDSDCPGEKRDCGALRPKPGAPTWGAGGSRLARSPRVIRRAGTRCSRPRHADRAPASGGKGAHTRVREGPTSHGWETSHQPASAPGERRDQAMRTCMHTRGRSRRGGSQSANKDDNRTIPHPPDGHKARIDDVDRRAVRRVTGGRLRFTG